MKYWKEGNTCAGYNEYGISLMNGEQDSCRTVAITKLDGGYVAIDEECDGAFGVVFNTKEDAIDALEEAILWIQTFDPTAERG